METKEKLYIRGNREIAKLGCRTCGKEIIKNSALQIVYYCSPECRHKKVFKWVKES